MDRDGARVIETPRLVLRPHGVEDHADCAAMWRDPAVVRFIGDGSPLGDEAVWARMLRYAGCWQLLGYGYWAVRERDSGRFVGDVGFQNLRRATQPILPDRPEIGWVLAAATHGHGYAREAVAAALAWVDARRIAATICIIRPDHVRSLRIAAEVGYARSGTVMLGGAPIELLTRGLRNGGAAPTS